MKGHELVGRVAKYLETGLSALGLTNEGDYSDNSLWHARINGLIAEAGIKNGFRVEIDRKFMRTKNQKTGFSEFLERYCALYRKYSVGKWPDFGDASHTDIDVAFLDSNSNLTKALCEYENERSQVADNIAKFKALNSFDPKRFQPELCLIGFWGDLRKYVEEVFSSATGLIARTAISEEALFEKKKYEFLPLESDWLLFGLFKDESLCTVKCLLRTFDSVAHKKDEMEFLIGPMPC